MTQRPGASALLRAHPIIAVLRAPEAADYDRVIDVLAKAGIVSIELTLSTPGTFDRLPRLIERYGAEVEIGVGTILGTEDAQRALDSGATYLVTPVTNPAVITLAVDAGVAVFPGGLTPTELSSAWAAGATAVKIFPAETVGARYASHLRGPFPDLEFIPSGGVALEHIPEWLNAGALAVSLGGPLIGDAFTGGSLTALAERAHRAIEMVEATR